MREQEQRDEGASPADARAAARRRFGSVAVARELARDAWLFGILESSWRDVQIAARSLWKAPGFALTAAATLALGIGAATAIFSVLDAVLLQSLPYPHADRLVRLYESNLAAGRPTAQVSPDTLADWHRSTQLDALSGIGATSFTLTGAAQVEQVAGALVTPEFLHVLGEPLALGRGFSPDDFESPANAVLGPLVFKPVEAAATAIVSHALWQRQFGGDPAVIGRRVRLNDQPTTILGVMHADYRFDADPSAPPVDAWIPLVASPFQGRRGFRLLDVVGRLRPGATLESVQAEMDGIAALIAQEHRANAGWGVRVMPLQESFVGNLRRPLLMIFGAVGCVLLIACTNVANLLLMRGVGRSREAAIRTALGAGRVRLLRQWLTESVLLSLLGGAAGFALASWILPILLARAPEGLPQLDAVRVNARVFAWSVGVSLLTGLLCGLAPGIGVRRHLGDLLRQVGSLHLTPGRRRVRQVLMVAQVASAVLLLVGTGLMVRSLMVVRSRPLGFAAPNVLTFTAPLRPQQYEGLAQYHAVMTAFIDRLEAIPGVTAAGIGTPPVGSPIGAEFVVEGHETPISTRATTASPGYFAALGITVREGRAFDPRDGAVTEPVAVVNQAFARQARGTERVVGRRVHLPLQPDRWLTVVGVVGDVRMAGLEADAPPMVYLPYLQAQWIVSTYVLRTSASTVAIVPVLRAAVEEFDPAVAVANVQTMEERIERAMASRMFSSWLAGLFSVIALAVAIVGVYALISESIANRTSEIGVRIALGARRTDVVTLVLRQGLSLVFAGLAFGLAAALALNRVMSSFVFEVSTTDTPTYAAVAAVWIATAIAASVIPALRASRVDPVLALRHE